jgi:UDP-N-acetylglucosamine--N-acetylmuramyl-(pentapeptide) pyrophosphoryl-undecaprenol N-acetylglucosamine transferase
MRARGWEVSWLGTAHGMEKDIVPKHGIRWTASTFAGLRGKGLGHTVKGAFKMLASFGTCRIPRRAQAGRGAGHGRLRHRAGRPDGALRGVPLALVNADAALLLSNKTLTPMASACCSASRPISARRPARPSSPATRCARKSWRCRAGPPLRQPQRPAEHPGGGRQPGREGAERQRAGGAGPDSEGCARWSPTSRARRISMPCARPMRSRRAKANVVDFIDDMAAEYANADLVICRAGAITVSELTAAGVASVLVPFVASTTSHQRDNAHLDGAAESGGPPAAGRIESAQLASCCKRLTATTAWRWPRRRRRSASATRTRRSRMCWNNWRRKQHETQDQAYPLRRHRRQRHERHRRSAAQPRLHRVGLGPGQQRRQPAPERTGRDVTLGHAPTTSRGADAVVTSTAVNEDNPEVVAARAARCRSCRARSCWAN